MQENGKAPLPMKAMGPTLIIQLDPQTGNISVNGPIHDRVLCLGLLELAKEAIALAAKQNQSRLTLSPSLPGIKS